MSMQQGQRTYLKKGQFYSIYQGPDDDSNPTLILEDKTKGGLEVRERSFDDKHGVESDKGMIYDMDGLGHRVGIRWYFPKPKYSLQDVAQIAEEMELRYKTIREMTCPDD
jgi:hypothetical protein